MHIYGSVVSPFVQRVLMAARAKGHEVEVRPVPGGAIHSPEFQSISAMGRIPLLELDDGRHICESSAIAAYLDEMLSGPSLLPSTPEDRARVREIEAVATLEYATGMRPVMVARVFRAPLAEAVVEAAIAQSEKGAAVLDKLLDRAGRYALGDTLTLADCVLVPVLTLASAVARVAGTEALVTGHARLAAYYEGVASDPVAARTIGEMREGFAAMMARNAAPAPAAA